VFPDGDVWQAATLTMAATVTEEMVIRLI
jgi:hypothetical protein